MNKLRHALAVGILCCAGLVLLAAELLAHEAAPREPATCAAAVDAFYADELWAKVVQRSCLVCHRTGGDAADSEFVLLDPSRTIGAAQQAAHRQNYALLTKLTEGDEALLLQKVRGDLDHGGSIVLASDSPGYRILREFIRRTTAPQTTRAASVTPSVRESEPVQLPEALFAAVTMLDDRRLLRRAALSLAGRLPTEAELQAVQQQGLAALPALLDTLMSEEGFYLRLREGFNDIFLTRGYGDGAESALAYDHFSKTRHWTQKHDLSHVGDAKAQTQARYKLADNYRAALLGEPMKLVEHIVRHDHPFTEIVTADYLMVTPYTARGYGIYDEVKDKFADPDDPYEYIPVKLRALVGRDRNQNQESATGFYPHAGLLGMFQYLRRYPTTETNRNRLRARMYYQQFLGIDALELAARVGDAARVTAKFEIPTMQAAECVVCHKTIDPVAGLFQDYYHFEGVYGRRKEGWYPDMFAAGFEEGSLPPGERWRALQWLGERTARDPRFAVAMVEHVYYILTGRKVLLPPKDIDDPQFAARQRAYRAQRCLIQTAAEHFTAEGFNLKQVFKELIQSDFYRADGLARSEMSEEQRAALDDLGVVRLLGPEQLERKIKAVFGTYWGRLNEQTAMLYGGIDSNEVTERATEPSGAIGALQRIMANDVAARNVLQDFARPAERRLLFPQLEPDVLPGASAEGDQAVRRAIVTLHERILGTYDAVDSPAVTRTFDLFQALVSAAHVKPGFDKQEIYYARTKVPDAPQDPHYTIRAWRGVVTYLLRRPEFLYE